jgi:hypothetical protein
MSRKTARTPVARGGSQTPSPTCSKPPAPMFDDSFLALPPVFPFGAKVRVKNTAHLIGVGVFVVLARVTTHFPGGSHDVYRVGCLVSNGQPGAIQEQFEQQFDASMLELAADEEFVLGPQEFVPHG